MLIKIKNKANNARHLRPFPDRSQCIILQPGETTQIETRHCAYDVSRAPAKWFEKYDCFVVIDEAKEIPTVKKPDVKSAPKPVVKEEPKPVAKEPVQEPKVELQPVKDLNKNPTGFKIEGKVIKQYNPDTKSWKRIRDIKDVVAGRVICDNGDGKNYVVESVYDGTLNLNGISKEEADKLIGV